MCVCDPNLSSLDSAAYILIRDTYPPDFTKAPNIMTKLIQPRRKLIALEKLRTPRRRTYALSE